MTWQTTYPPLAMVMQAHWQTLDTWANSLPAPQTDVERTVYRRIHARRAELVQAEMREKAPEVAEKYESFMDRLRRIVDRAPHEQRRP